jgi:pimeloyl-ACP methyl ester carboxylesterase
MTATALIVLPGLDGTGQLLEDFLAKVPSGIVAHALRLPDDQPQNYQALAQWATPLILPKPVVLVAESFSGPLAILLAQRCSNVASVVLCASFCKSPKPAWLAGLPAAIWRRPPPVALLQTFLTGGDRALAQAVQRSMSSVRPQAIAERIAAALRADVTEELAQMQQPLLYLRALRDRVVSAKSGEHIRKLLPSTQLRELPAPHLLLQAAPSAAWREIELFLT